VRPVVGSGLLEDRQRVEVRLDDPRDREVTGTERGERAHPGPGGAAQGLGQRAQGERKVERLVEVGPGLARRVHERAVGPREEP
jgi:hypothetical protein